MRCLALVIGVDLRMQTIMTIRQIRSPLAHRSSARSQLKVLLLRGLLQIHSNNALNYKPH